MAPLSLSQLLEVAIGTPEAGAVNFAALRSLLLAVLGHLGLQDLPAPALGGAQPAEEPPAGTGGQAGGPDIEAAVPPLEGTASSSQVASMAADVEQMTEKIKAHESGISKAMALSQHLLGEIGGVKAAQSCLAEDIRTLQEFLGLGNLQDTAGHLPTLHDQTALDSDTKRLKEQLSLSPTPEEEGSGGQSAPAEPPALDLDAPHMARSALGLKGAGTQPVPTTNEGAAGTQPGSLGMGAGLQRAPVTPEEQAGTPTDRTRTSDTSTTTLGMQPGTPGTQTTTSGVQPETPGTQTTTPRVQPGSPNTQTTSPGMQPAPPGTQGGGAAVQPGPSHMEPSLHGAERVPVEATPGVWGTQMDVTSPKEGGKALPSAQLALAGHSAAGTLLPTAQGMESPLEAGARTMGSSQEPAVSWGSSVSSSAPDCYVEMVEALCQIKQLGHLYATLKEKVAQLEATRSDHAEVENLCKLIPEGDQKSIASILADLQSQASSLQGLASDLQGEKGKIGQLEDALGKLEVAAANLKVDLSDQITLQVGSPLQEIKQKLKELGEQQETAKATLEQLVTQTAKQLQEQLDKLRAMPESAGRGQAEGQAACPVCSTDISTQLGQLLQRYEKLQELVDSFLSQQPVAKVVRQQPARSQQDEEVLKRIQATIAHLQGDCEKLSSVTRNLLDDRHQEQKDIKALFQSLDRLEKEKADKEDVLRGIDVKAHKAALASKVSCAQFDASVERLNEKIQEVLSRVTGQEWGWHQLQQQLTEQMDSKLDRLELELFQQQLEKRWKSFLKQLKAHLPQADDAAGIKKQLLAPFDCLSCDRPLSMVVPGPHVVTVPSMPPLPSCLAGDTHTKLEQEQTPQHGHRERVADWRYPSVPRQCGGRHTLTQPLQRCPRLLPPSHGAPQPVQIPVKCDKTALLGQDGHIYWGRQEGQLPVLVAKEGFPRDQSKMSPRQWDSQHSGCLLSRSPSTGSSLSQAGTPTSPGDRSALSHGHLSRTSGLLPPLQPPRDGSSTPAAGQDRQSPAEPPPSQPPSRRASGSSQQQ